jgi:hypothetical protein
MQVFQKSIGTFSDSNHPEIPFDPQLFLLFVSPIFDDPDGFLQRLRNAFPNASVFGCSTAGEIAPFDQFSACELHNQTMTITTFAE